jgi:4-hydroxybenzoate polyprenyltransferase
MAFNASRIATWMQPTAHGEATIPAGLLSVGAVWAFFLTCCAGFLASTLVFLVRQPVADNPAVPSCCSSALTR